MFSTAVDVVFVAKPLILGILPSISMILILESVFLTRLLVSGIFFPNSVYTSVYTSVLYLVFKTNELVSILFALEANLSYTVFF